MNKRVKRVVPTLLAASVMLALAGTAAAQDTQATTGTDQQPTTQSSNQSR